MPEFIWNKEGFPCKIGRHSETKVFQRKTVISPLYPKTFFDNRIFLKQWMVLPRKLLHCERKKLSIKNTDNPFICMNFSHIRIFLKLWRVPPRSFLALWVYKIIQQELVISPSWAEKFLDTRIFLTHWMVPPRTFSALRDEKKFNTKRLHPFLMHKVCRSPSISETLNSYPKNFSALWDFKNAQGKVVMSNFYTWKFSIPEVSWNIEEYSTSFSGTTRQKNSK